MTSFLSIFSFRFQTTTIINNDTLLFTDTNYNDESNESQSTVILGEDENGPTEPVNNIPPDAVEEITDSPAPVQAAAALNATSSDVVILLDDTQVDIAPVDNSQSDDLVYVQTIHNPDVPIIDLCDVVEDHSYSRPEDVNPTRRRRRLNTNERSRSRSRSPITVEHSYAGGGVSLFFSPIRIIVPETPPAQQIPTRDMPPPAPRAQRPAEATSPDRNSPLNQSLNNTISQFGTCSICLESYLRRQPHSTVCGHVFCKTCILAAIQATKSCPLCRKKLNGKSIHPLHL